jgi:hypothetical protein
MNSPQSTSYYNLSPFVGTFAKVSRCRFSQHGNKFGIADGDGNLSLWQVGLASQSNRPFFVCEQN